MRKLLLAGAVLVPLAAHAQSAIYSPPFGPHTANAAVVTEATTARAAEGTRRTHLATEPTTARTAEAAAEAEAAAVQFSANGAAAAVSAEATTARTAEAANAAAVTTEADAGAFLATPLSSRRASEYVTVASRLPVSAGGATVTGGLTTDTLTVNGANALTIGTSISPAAPGCVIAPGSSVCRAPVVRAGDVVNIRDYGALCNGATDDTIAIRAAVTQALLSATAAHIYSPAGRCLISAALAISLPRQAMIIDGDGPDASEWVWTSDTDGLDVTFLSNAFWMRGPYTNAAGGGSYTGAGLTVRNISFVNDNQLATGLGAGTALNVHGDTISGRPGPGTTISNVVITGASQRQGWATGLNLFQVGYSNIDGLTLFGNQNAASNTEVGIALSGTSRTNESVDHHWRNIRANYLNVVAQIGNGVQGVYINELTVVSANYGVTWNVSAGTPEDSLTIIGGHIAARIRGVQTSNVYTVDINNVYLLASNDNLTPWIGLDVANSGFANLNNNIFHGTNYGDQSGIVLCRDSTVPVQYPMHIIGNQLANLSNTAVNFCSSFTGNAYVADNTMQFNKTHIGTHPASVIVGVNNINIGATIPNLTNALTVNNLTAGSVAIFALPTCASGLASGTLCTGSGGGSVAVNKMP